MRLTKVVVCLSLALGACADRSVAPEFARPVAQLSASADPVPNVVITEVMPNAAVVTGGNETNSEWFEVYNAGGTTVDLKDYWVFSYNGANAESTKIAISVPLAPRAYAVFARTAEAGIPGFYQISTIQLNNSDTDWLALRTPDRTASLDSVSYSERDAAGTVINPKFSPSGGPGAGYDGKSLALVDLNLNGSPDENNARFASNTAWVQSTNIFRATPLIQGTPGTGPFTNSSVTRSVAVTYLPATIKVGNTIQFSATLTENGVVVPGTVFTYTSSDPAKVRIDNAATGAATALAVTTSPVTITATAAVVGTTGTAQLSVTAVKSITITPASIVLGTPTQMVAQLFVDGVETPTSFLWGSADNTVIEITSSGLATGKKKASTTVSVVASDGTAGSRTVSVIAGTLDITIDGLNDVPAGFTKNAFVITYKDANGVNRSFSEIQWLSRNPATATVDGSYITGVSAGDTWIIASGVDGAIDSTIIRVQAFTDQSSADYSRANAEFGEPVDGDPADDFLVRRKQYTYSYNDARGTANWVAWVVNATHFNDDVDRCDCFTVDPALSSFAKKIHHRDYTGSGYSRGHMAMSEQRTVTLSENATSFYMSNMLPQMQTNNGGPWLNFENYISKLAEEQGKEVYNIAGGIYLTGAHTIAGKLVVPSWTWKVAVIMPRGKGLADATALDKLEVIAIRTPNDHRAGVPGSVIGILNDWTKYETTVDEIEQQTGYDLLALLRDDLEKIIEFDDHAPVAHPGGPYSGNEGSAITFDASASTDVDLPRGDVLSFYWTFSDGTSATGQQVTKTFADNGSYTATLRVADNYGLDHTATAPVTVSNVAPVLHSVTYPPGPFSVNQVVTVSAVFSDVPADTPQLTVNWGDGTSSTGPASSATHSYANAGFYVMRVSVADEDGGTVIGPRSAPTPVFDAAAGELHGGGWFNAEDGSFLDPKKKDKTHINTLGRYVGTQLEGNLSVHTNGNDFRFTSSKLDWMVVIGGDVVLTGSGEVEGVTGVHRFVAVFKDGDKDDRVRITITNPAGLVVFDNERGSPLYGVPATELQGGNLTVKR